MEESVENAWRTSLVRRLSRLLRIFLSFRTNYLFASLPGKAFRSLFFLSCGRFAFMTDSTRFADRFGFAHCPPTHFCPADEAQTYATRRTSSLLTRATATPTARPALLILVMRWSLRNHNALHPGIQRGEGAPRPSPRTANASTCVLIISNVDHRKQWLCIVSLTVPLVIGGGYMPAQDHSDPPRSSSLVRHPSCSVGTPKMKRAHLSDILEEDNKKR